MAFSALLPLFARLLWPEHCPVCGRVGVSHCAGCLFAAVCPPPAFCLECGGKYGLDCCAGSVPCYAAALHEGAARDFLLALKYRNTRDLGAPMGLLMARALPPVRADALLPVPLHKKSRRGYNQTSLIASGIAEERGLPMLYNALLWNIETGTQTGKAGHERRSLPQNAFRADRSLYGRRVILVDDVYTTGGTLRAACRAAEEAGAAVAAAFVWTRRVPSRENPAAWDLKL